METTTLPTLDYKIQVDRLLPVELGCERKYVYPDLQSEGLAEYNLRTQVTYDKPLTDRVILGEKIFSFLKVNKKNLGLYLGIHDGLEILKKGPEVYRVVFGNKYTILWKSVCWQQKKLVVPCLYISGEKLIITWLWLGYGFGLEHIGPRFSR